MTQYLAVILGIFGLELGIKNYIEKEKTEGRDEKALGGAIIIRKHHNRGAFLNVGQRNRVVIAALSVFLTLLATGMFVATLGQNGKGMLKWGLTLLLGGAYSNTYDRLFRKYVVDYVSFHVPMKGLRKVVFNIGDFCIMIGALFSAIGYCQS